MLFNISWGRHKIPVTSSHRFEDIAYLLGEDSFTLASVRICDKWVKMSTKDTIGDAYLRFTTCTKMKRYGIPFPLSESPNLWVQTWHLLLTNVTPGRYWGAFHQMVRQKQISWGIPSKIQVFLGIGTLEWNGPKKVPVTQQMLPRSKFHMNGLHSKFINYLLQFLDLQHNPRAVDMLHRAIPSVLLLRQLTSAVASMLNVPNTLVTKTAWGNRTICPYDFRDTRLRFSLKLRKGRSIPNPDLVEAMKSSGAPRLIAEALMEANSVTKQEWQLKQYFGSKPSTKRRRPIDLTS